MLEFEGLNYWAVLVCWVLTVVVGAYWYSPAGFGKVWSKLSGVDIMKLPQNEANSAIISVAISSLFQVIALAVLLNSLDVTEIVPAIFTSLFIWFGFTAITTIGVTLYQRRSWRFWWLNASFFLVVMVLNALILTVWK